VARGPRRNPLDFGGNLDQVALELGLGFTSHLSGQCYGSVKAESQHATLGVHYPAFSLQLKGTVGPWLRYTFY